MKKIKTEPTDIQANLDNRWKTLKGGKENTYDSEPDPEPYGIFLVDIP